MRQQLTPEQAAGELDIRPPRAGQARTPNSQSRIFISIRTRQGRSCNSAAIPGPFAVIMALLVVVALAIVTLLAVLGTVLLWLPMLGLLVLLLFVSGFLRKYLNRLHR